MAVNPNTTIDLCYVPFDQNYLNTTKFSSVADQNSYFNTTVVYNMVPCSYMRKEQVLRVDKHYDDIQNCNYIRYQNINYGNKYFYAFIIQKTYQNDKCTYCTIATDVFQTWQFDVSIRNSFTIREHQEQYNENGLPIINTIEEGIDIGDSYDIMSDVRISFETTSTYDFMIMSTIDLGADPGTEDNPNLVSATGTIVNGVYSAYNYYLIGTINNTSLITILTAFSNYAWVTQGIQAINYVPKIVSTRMNTQLITNEAVGINIYQITGLNTASPVTYTIPNFYDRFPSYTYSKMKLYPYSYIEVTNFTGDNLILKPENIDGSNIEITTEFSFIDGIRVSYIITNYNTNNGGSTGDQLDRAYTVTDYASVPTLIDNGQLYRAENASSLKAQQTGININAGVTTIGLIASALAAPYTGGLSLIGAAGLAGNVGSIVNQQEQLNAKLKDTELISPAVLSQIGGQIFNLVNDRSGITFRFKTIKREYRDKADNHFKYYGQKINKVKIPNLTEYTNGLNYVQTNNCVVIGAIPQSDLVKFQQILNRGVSVYKNPNSIGAI